MSRIPLCHTEQPIGNFLEFAYLTRLELVKHGANEFLAAYRYFENRRVCLRYYVTENLW